ncbi:hypothetical protein ONZ45_g10707 [Pleurotus djamor]|nr:hypothetical protein ONZ45_g10707 [Pleurotus djamor]
MNALAQRNFAVEIPGKLGLYFSNPTGFLNMMYATSSMVGGAFATAVIRGSDIQATSTVLEVFIDHRRISTMDAWLTRSHFIADHQLITPPGASVISQRAIGARVQNYEIPAAMDLSNNPLTLGVVTYKGPNNRFVRLAFVVVTDVTSMIFTMPHSGLMNFFTAGWIMSLFPELTMSGRALKFHPGLSPDVRQWEERGWIITTTIPDGQFEVWHTLQNDPRAFRQALGLFGTEQANKFAERLSPRQWRLTIDPPIRLLIVEVA